MFITLVDDWGPLGYAAYIAVYASLEILAGAPWRAQQCSLRARDAESACTTGRLAGWQLLAPHNSAAEAAASNSLQCAPLLPAIRSAGHPADDDSWRHLWSCARHSGGVCGCHAGLYRRLPHSAVSGRRRLLPAPSALPALLRMPH
jgi:hypothetical protein